MTLNTIKIIQSLVYLAYSQKDHKMDFMKAYKLLWLADRLHLRLYGRTISGDNYFAMPFGIVPSDAKHILENENTNIPTPDGYAREYIKIVAKHKYKAIIEPVLREFSQTDREILDRVIGEYGDMEPMELSEMSHKYPEWKKYEPMLNDENEKNAFPVNMDLFFEDCAEDTTGFFKCNPEQLSLAKDLYHQYSRC